MVDSDYVLARGVTTLGALTDVNAPSPTNGQALVYNTATSKWIPGAASGGGGGSADSATILALIDSDYIIARAGQSVYSNFRFTATATQTSFTGNDVAGNTLAINSSGVQAYLNGFHLLKDIDYTITGTTTLVLTTGAALGDDLVITSLNAIVGGGGGGGLSSSAVVSIVDSAVAALVDAAPTTLNTLNELAAALNDDSNYAATTTAALATKLDNTSSITSLADVDSATPTEGQILIWDNGNSYWAPGVLPAGTDSAAVTGMIDSAYVTARTPVNTFTNAVNFANYYYVADSGQTVFSGNDANGEALAIDTANYQVFNNGVRLVSGVDYTVNAAANSLTLNGFTADSGDDLVINTLSQTVTQSHMVVGDTFMNTFKFIATNGQTSFTGTDANSKTLGIDSSNFNVFQNGIKLMDSDDFTSNPITNTITLTTGASTSDEITITAIENKASNVTVDAAALAGLVDSAYIAARVNTSAAWTEITTTPITVVANERLIVDTSTAKTVNLPATATLGDEVRIIDGTGQAATNAITIGRNGHKIDGSDSDLTVDVNRAAFGLVYYNVANGWLFTEK